MTNLTNVRRLSGFKLIKESLYNNYNKTFIQYHNV